MQFSCASIRSRYLPFMLSFLSSMICVNFCCFGAAFLCLGWKGKECSWVQAWIWLGGRSCWLLYPGLWQRHIQERGWFLHRRHYSWKESCSSELNPLISSALVDSCSSFFDEIVHIINHAKPILEEKYFRRVGSLLLLFTLHKYAFLVKAML